MICIRMGVWLFVMRLLFLCRTARSPLLVPDSCAQLALASADNFREAGVPSIKLAGTLSADSRGPLGGIIENQVAVELSRPRMLLHGRKKSSSGTEIDFVHLQTASAPLSTLALSGGGRILNVPVYLAERLHDLTAS